MYEKVFIKNRKVKTGSNPEQFKSAVNRTRSSLSRYHQECGACRAAVWTLWLLSLQTVSPARLEPLFSPPLHTASAATLKLTGPTSRRGNKLCSSVRCQRADARKENAFFHSSQRQNHWMVLAMESHVCSTVCSRMMHIFKLVLHDQTTQRESSVL